MNQTEKMSKVCLMFLISSSAKITKHNFHMTKKYEDNGKPSKK